MKTQGHSQSSVADCRFVRWGGTPHGHSSIGHRQAAIGNAWQSAFSLVEILITITLLAVIVLGLLAMFQQTQRAFRSSITQTDVLEAGRATMDLVTREMEQTVPSYRNVVNFFAQIPISPPLAPLSQTLPGGSTVPQRTNVLQDLYFLTRQNQTWVGIGYCVRVSDGSSMGLPDSGVGTLYRFIMATNALHQDPYPVRRLFTAFSEACHSPILTNLNRVADGVVHFRVAMFDTNGVRLTWNLGTNTIIGGRSVVPGELRNYYFLNNAVPAYVDVELGVLESQVLARYRAMVGSPSVAQAYLRDQAGRVHLFRQRVPIRNVDTEAYR